MEAQPQHRAIVPLDPDVRAQLQSSIAITSMDDVIVELVKNALDAHASNVEVKIDIRKGACEVEDDGHGIPAADFAPDGGLGKQYHTSKAGSSTATYGQQGQFLASLAAVSLLSLTSRHINEATECNLTLHRSQVLTRETSSNSDRFARLRNRGTVVAVHDLFGNLPVRVKDRALHSNSREEATKNLETFRRRVLGITLGWAKPIRIAILDKVHALNLMFRIGPKGDATQRGHILNKSADSGFNLGTIVSLFKQSYSLEAVQSGCWTLVSARTLNLSARAAVCLEPIPTRQMQYISLGIRPLEQRNNHSIIYEEINRIFAASTFSVRDTVSDLNDGEIARRRKDRRYKIDGPTKSRLKEQSRGPDRHPMFYIRIDGVSEKDKRLEGISSCEPLSSDCTIEDIIELLRPMFWQFLKQHGYRPCKRRKARSEDQPLRRNPATQLHGATVTDGGARQEPSVLESGHDPRRLSQSVQHHRPPSRAFLDWSRIKSSSKSCLDDLGSGLSVYEYNVRNQLDNPNQNMPVEAAKMLPSATVGMDPGSAEQDKDGEELYQARESSVPVFGPEDMSGRMELTSSNMSDPVILWKNPNSGEAIRLNARTGVVIPIRSQDSRPHSISSIKRSDHLNNPVQRRSARLLAGDSMLASSSASDNKWAKKVLDDWKNPVFRLGEASIRSVATTKDTFEFSSCCHANPSGTPFIDTSNNLYGRLSKSALATADVIGQVDDKFILISIQVDNDPGRDTSDADQILVLVDQHAADERIRIEGLFEGLCSATKPGSIHVGLPEPMGFDISSQEATMFQHSTEFFAEWGIRYQIKKMNDGPPTPSSGISRPPSESSSTAHPRRQGVYMMIIQSLPSLIIEKCRLEPRVLIDLLREEIWKRDKDGSTSRITSNNSRQNGSSNPVSPSETWLHRIHSCPKSLVNLLNSRACRSAIMFNDKLSRGKCEELVRSLGTCKFPFQCAHGRRSMVPLVNEDVLGPDGLPEDKNFSQVWEQWQR